LLILTILLSISAVSAAENSTSDLNGVSDTQDNSYDDTTINTVSSSSKSINMEESKVNTNTKQISKDNTAQTKTASQHTTKMTVSDRVAYVSSNVNLLATVADKTTGTYANGGTVVFKVNGITVGKSTLTNGKATYKYSTASLSAKNYTISAVYSGSGIYASTKTTKDAKLTLMPIATKMTVSAISAYQTKVLLKATVVDKVNGKYLSDGKVVFKIDGKTVGTVNLDDGKASFTYDASDLFAGKYTISAVYSGTGTYSSYRANNTLTIKTQSSFTFSQIRDAAIALRTQYEANNVIDYVTVGTSKLHVQDFLYMMSVAIKNLNSGKTPNVSIKNFKAPSSQTDTLKEGTLTSSEFVSLAKNIISYMDSKSTAPSSMSTRLGNIGYYNMIYIFTKILDVSTSSYLVTTCSVYNWKVLHPSNPKSRIIYITSDNIFSTSKDVAFINQIIKALENKGYEAHMVGVGPNTHNTKIWGKVYPINAVQVSIFGGADAGVIYDVCTRSFMRAKANRMLFFVYHSGSSIDITNRTWLKRAHDDNYSPSSFTGIAYPDVYLKSHGYDYVYSSDVNTIANRIIEYIS